MTATPNQLIEIEKDTFHGILRKASEKEASLMKEIEALNKLLELFAYSTSHDLRSPLTSLMGLVNLLNDESDPQSRKVYLEMMKQSIVKQDVTVKNITEILKNARQKPVREKVDFEKILPQIFSSLAYLDPYDEVQKTYKANSVDCAFYSDRIRLEVILNNLIANAIKFQRPGKKGQLVDVKISVKPDKASIWIIDNGIGIENHYQDQVFDIFFRATDYKAGSGLGLYVVKEMVKTLGGKVGFESIAGKGTLFFLEIPNMIPCKKSK